MENIKNKGTLYLIPTPIGNLNDISKRFYEVLDIVDYVACEDTRNTQKLLNLLNIKKKLISCHEHNEKEATSNIINLLNRGIDIGYMSDAGSPCISDPGEVLVKEAIKESIKVTPICGPNAFLNALIGSGLDTSHFLFFGFLPSKENERKNELEILKTLQNTIIFYESPHRIETTLKNLYEVFGNRKITIARELTKIHEEFIRSDLETLLKSPSLNLKGELVLIVEGCIDTLTYQKEEILKDLDLLIKNGLTSKKAIESYSKIKKLNKNYISKIFYDNN